MLKADLHIHSKYSLDGEFEIKNILRNCDDTDINIISICDHNSIKGVSEALQLITEYKVKLVSGIEIDCNYKGIDLHLLGYNINWESEDFLKLENDYNSKMLNSFSCMIYNLNKIGIQADSAEILLKAEGKPPCAELIAEVLISDENNMRNEKLRPYFPGGTRSDMPYINFYYDFFAQDKSAYVQLDHIDYLKAVDLIKENNGIPVVAHPGLNLKGKERIVEELVDNGAEGLEVFNNYHDHKQIAYFIDIAKKRNIMVTCGSDFHGKNKPLIKIGEFNRIDRFENYTINSISKFIEPDIASGCCHSVRGSY